MDPIANMLTTIRNALTVNHQDVVVPFSHFKQDLLEVFEKEGIVSDVTADTANRTLHFSIVQEGPKSLISTIKRMSTPGRRRYVGWKEIPRPSGNGLVIISTSQGLMTGHAAHSRKLGGELICEIT